jgi:hypothetical protein
MPIKLSAEYVSLLDPRKAAKGRWDKQPTSTK